MKTSLRLGGRWIAFALAVVLAGVVLVISEAAYWRSHNSMARLDAITATRANLQQLLYELSAADIAQRRYLLSGQDDPLQTCRAALKAGSESLERLATYYRDDSALRPRQQELDAAVRQRQASIESVIGLYRAGQREQAIAQTVADPGRVQLESIRALADELDAAEAGKFTGARDSIDRTLVFNRIGIDAMVVLGILALFFYLRQAAAIDELRASQQRAIQNERDHLELAVRRRTEQLIELARHLQSAREDERSRLARELHDELGALLTAAKLDAARIRSRLGTREPEALERLAHLIETLNEGIALKRRIIEDLRPSSLDNLGLVAALEILAREFGQTAKVEVRCQLDPARLSPAAQLTVYRLVQEAFTNIAKYARAQHVDVSMGTKDGIVSIAVVDDGAGFDPAVQKQSAHGLLGMRYRVEADGGTLTIESAPGRGTRISASLPEDTSA
ncbi:MAG: CHASE3 domain-containing protein [Gemmatimonadota bacterium]